MRYPKRDKFVELAKDFNLIPVYADVIADTETPVSAFRKLDGNGYSFLLESAEGGERFGRYSFIGINPHFVMKSRAGHLEVLDGRRGVVRCRDGVKNPLDELRETVNACRAYRPEGLPPFCGGAVGYVGYDAVRCFEDVPREADDDLGLPDMIMMFTDEMFIFDHLTHRLKVVVNAHVDDDAEAAYEQALARIDTMRKMLNTSARQTSRPVDASAAADSTVSKERFEEIVASAKEYIAAGDVLQVVLSQRFSVTTDAAPFDVYRALRTINPAPYMYYLNFGDLKLIGCSPEPLVKVVGDDIITCPIAGTRPRGLTPEDDARLMDELLRDEKERAEHIMLVDLARNDLGRVCVPGTVSVDDLMQIEKASHVMHIVSHVSGKLAPDKDAFDALGACFPAGTVSGAPKIRAMEIIDELEPTLRGPYAGVVGYFSYTGDLDTCITIRTIVAAGGRVHVQAGAGIVYDSQPEREYQETVNKAQALLAAVHLAEKGMEVA